MDWLQKALADAAQALADAEKQVREATRNFDGRSGGAVVRNSTVSGGGGGYNVMSFRNNGRQVMIGPGYVVVEHTYWLTTSPDVRVARDGGVWQDGVELRSGRPVPGYTPRGGIVVKLAGGRLTINGRSIVDYVAPRGAEDTTVEQYGGNGDGVITNGVHFG